MTLYQFSWWDLIPLPLLILALRSMFFRRVVGQTNNKESAGYMALYSLTYMVIDIIRHRTGYAVFDAGMFALWAHSWWNSGGGDSVKNFIRSFGLKPAVN